VLRVLSARLAQLAHRVLRVIRDRLVPMVRRVQQV
jgi:hypothetical protein